MDREGIDDGKGASVLFATCSYPDYNPELGGLPVRSSNGTPRYKLKYEPFAAHLLPVMRTTFPDMKWVKASQTGAMARAEFVDLYRDLILGRIDQILTEADQVRAKAGVPEDTRLVLMCFCRLARPDTWCHRSIYAAVWREVSGHEVPEYAPGKPPETAAEERARQGGLF